MQIDDCDCHHVFNSQNTGDDDAPRLVCTSVDPEVILCESVDLLYVPVRLQPPRLLCKPDMACGCGTCDAEQSMLMGRVMLPGTVDLQPLAE